MRVSAQNLSMSFDDAGRTVEVFRGLNLEVSPGERVAIVGASGVGKTTLLYILGALEIPTAGTVWYGDTNVTSRAKSGEDLAPFRGEHIGFVFQFHQLLAEFSALENVAMPLLLQGQTWAEAEKRSRRLLERVGLAERITHRPGQLSGGEQQRVALARALVANPSVLLADEPTGNLDRKTSEGVIQVLLEMQKEERNTLMIVTHSMELAKRMDRVLELTTTGLSVC